MSYRHKVGIYRILVIQGKMSQEGNRRVKARGGDRSGQATGLGASEQEVGVPSTGDTTGRFKRQSNLNRLSIQEIIGLTRLMVSKDRTPPGAAPHTHYTSGRSWGGACRPLWGLTAGNTMGQAVGSKRCKAWGGGRGTESSDSGNCWEQLCVAG